MCFGWFSSALEFSPRSVEETYLLLLAPCLPPTFLPPACFLSWVEVDFLPSAPKPHNLFAHWNSRPRQQASVNTVAFAPWEAGLILAAGSSDGTVPLLQLLSAELKQLEVPHLINTSAHDVRGSRNRLQFLADMRNAALAPMHANVARGAAPHERLLFLNDVLFCAADVARLLVGDHRATDMACGMDFYKEPDHLYDTWVSTDLQGTKLLHHAPYVQHADAAALLSVERRKP